MRKLRLMDSKDKPFPLMTEFMSTLEENNRRWFKKLNDNKLQEIQKVTSKEVQTGKIDITDERIIKLFSENTDKYLFGDISFWYIETNKIYELKYNVEDKSNNKCDEGYYIKE